MTFEVHKHNDRGFLFMVGKTWKVSICFFCTFCFLLYPWSIFCETILSFDEAVSKTLALSPKLRIAGSEISAKAGAKLKAPYCPTLCLGIVLKCFEIKIGKMEAAESRYEVAQLIETGGEVIDIRLQNSIMLPRQGLKLSTVCSHRLVKLFT